MDTPTLVVIGMTSALGALFSVRRQKKKAHQMVPAIEAALRAHGALSLPAVGEAIGFKGLMARGSVMFALEELRKAGKIRIIPAPDGTPQLQKINFIKYELTG